MNVLLMGWRLLYLLKHKESNKMPGWAASQVLESKEQAQRARKTNKKKKSKTHTNTKAKAGRSSLNSPFPYNYVLSAHHLHNTLQARVRVRLHVCEISLRLQVRNVTLHHTGQR